MNASYTLLSLIIIFLLIFLYISWVVVSNEIVNREKASPSAVLLDPKGTVGRLYNAKTTPHMYIIDPLGTLLYQGAIDSIRSTKIVDIPKAKNYVWVALNASMNGKAINVSDTQPYGCSVKYAK